MKCVFGIAQECAIHPSEAIAIFALIVSIVAIYLTIRHNKLTSKPHLTLESRTFTGKDGAYYFESTLCNFGFGPAIIEEFKIIIDGAEYVFDHPDELTKEINQFINRELFNPTFMIYRTGAVIGKETQTVVASFGLSGCTPQDIADIKSKLEKISLEVKFKSVYGDKETYNTKSHKRDFRKIKLNL